MLIPVLNKLVNLAIDRETFLVEPHASAGICSGSSGLRPQEKDCLCPSRSRRYGLNGGSKSEIRARTEEFREVRLHSRFILRSSGATPPAERQTVRPVNEKKCNPVLRQSFSAGAPAPEREDKLTNQPATEAPLSLYGWPLFTHLVLVL